MARYEIHGGAPLSGSVTVSGAKNAVVAILPAALLVNGPCRIENVPDISDVRILLDILRDMGATIEKPEPGVVVIDCSGVTQTRPDETLVRISLKYYGDKKLWPYIVKYNSLARPDDLSKGMKIVIPKLKPRN